MKTKLLLSIVFYFLICSVIAQVHSELTREKAFFYLVKTHNTNDYDFIKNSYGFNFDKFNYNKSKSDEFERSKYKNKIENTIKQGVDKINFSDKFTATCTGELGEYNFNGNFFPINSWNWNVSWGFEQDNALG